MFLSHSADSVNTSCVWITLDFQIHFDYHLAPMLILNSETNLNIQVPRVTLLPTWTYKGLEVYHGKFSYFAGRFRGLSHH